MTIRSMQNDDAGKAVWPTPSQITCTASSERVGELGGVIARGQRVELGADHQDRPVDVDRSDRFDGVFVAGQGVAEVRPVDLRREVGAVDDQVGDLERRSRATIRLPRPPAAGSDRRRRGAASADASPSRASPSAVASSGQSPAYVSALWMTPSNVSSSTAVGSPAKSSVGSSSADDRSSSSAERVSSPIGHASL